MKEVCVMRIFSTQQQSNSELLKLSFIFVAVLVWIHQYMYKIDRNNVYLAYATVTLFTFSPVFYL